MVAVTITKHDRGGAGEYQAHVADSDHIGRLTWVEQDGVHIADRGVAAQLVEALVADARENQFRIRPMCSYVAAAFDKHPEWSDLRD